MTIVASNFVEGKIPSDHPENTKPGTDGSRKLVGMMKYPFVKDIEFYPIRRILLSSTDYKKLFISPGKFCTHFKDNEMLVYSVHDNRTQMYYKK